MWLILLAVPIWLLIEVVVWLVIAFDSGPKGVPIMKNPPPPPKRKTRK